MSYQASEAEKPLQAEYAPPPLEMNTSLIPLRNRVKYHLQGSNEMFSINLTFIEKDLANDTPEVTTVRTAGELVLSPRSTYM